MKTLFSIFSISMLLPSAVPMSIIGAPSGMSKVVRLVSSFNIFPLKRIFCFSGGTVVKLQSLAELYLSTFECFHVFRLVQEEIDLLFAPVYFDFHTLFFFNLHRIIYWLIWSLKAKFHNKIMTEKDGEDTIHLKVKSQENDEVFFKIKRSTQLGKLMQKYCERQGVSRFLPDHEPAECPISLRWRANPGEEHPERPQHAERRRDRCCGRAGWRQTLSRESAWVTLEVFCESNQRVTPLIGHLLTNFDLNQSFEDSILTSMFVISTLQCRLLLKLQLSRLQTGKWMMLPLSLALA